MSTPKKALSYQDLWDQCDAERRRTLAWHDVHTTKGNTDIVARFSREHQIFEALQILIGRIADSDIIKNELKAIARQERAAASQSSSDNEVIYDRD